MHNPITNLTSRERLGLAAFTGVLCALTVGGWTYRQAAPAASPLTIHAGITGGDKTTAVVAAANKPTPAPAPTPAPPKEIVVYVTGAVKRPGVYSFKPGERLYHAVRKAGGFKDGARQDALNLADVLKDADQLYIPSRIEEKKHAGPEDSTCAALNRDPEPAARPAARAASAASASSAATVTPGRVLGRPAAPVVASTLSAPRRMASAKPAGAGSAPASPAKSAKISSPDDGVVNLNSAGAEELQRLPGIGPAMAERILAYRKEAGRFQEVAELREVPGIGAKKFAKLEKLVAI